MNHRRPIIHEPIELRSPFVPSPSLRINPFVPSSESVSRGDLRAFRGIVNGLIVSAFLWGAIYAGYRAVKYVLTVDHAVSAWAAKVGS